MKATLNFIVQYYFPSRFIWGGVALAAVVAFMATYFYLLGIMALIGGVLVFTTHYGLEIDLTTRQYQEYTCVLGFRIGEKIKYDSIRYLFIKDVKLSQTFNSRFLNSSTITFKEYRGYIKFSNEEKLHCLTNKNFDALVIDLKERAKQMNIALFDYTSGHPVQLA
jgi:hypothetical protein